MLKYINISNIEIFSNILVNVVVVIGGVLGLLYIRNLKEKQRESVFNYLSKMKVRIQYFLGTFKENKVELLDRLLQENSRREIATQRVFFQGEIIKQFAERAKETINFLMETDNQMPAGENWTEHFNIFLEFLLDFENVSNEKYFKWVATDGNEEKQEKYYVRHINNLEEMLDKIDKCQKEIERKMF